jgi:hypothetical protein
MLIQNKV